MENTTDSLQTPLRLSLDENVKTCRKCGVSFPASAKFFYRNPGGRFGLTPRCKSCVDEDNKASLAKRLAASPDAVRARANERAKRHYWKNIEKNRKKQREHQAKRLADPEMRKTIQARKRGGGARLTPEQIEEIFQSQGRVCAICGSDHAGSKGGWNLDHCHKTGRVRFILCAHCNRGLGAFKDNPETMRKAADMIEKMNQADKPVGAING